MGGGGAEAAGLKCLIRKAMSLCQDQEVIPEGTFFQGGKAGEKVIRRQGGQERLSEEFDFSGCWRGARGGEQGGVKLAAAEAVNEGVGLILPEVEGQAWMLL